MRAVWAVWAASVAGAGHGVRAVGAVRAVRAVWAVRAAGVGHGLEPVKHRWRGGSA